MKARMNFLVVGSCAAVIALACLSTGAAAQTGAGKVNWNLKLNETRGPLRSVDTKHEGKDAESQILGSPSSGSDNDRVERIIQFEQGHLPWTRFFDHGYS